MKVILMDRIEYADFAKLEMRTGKIVSAEPLVGSRKLLKVTVDIGDAQPRVILAGIAPNYAPETLAGKRVIVLANLAPKQMAGAMSDGMILMADMEGKPVFVAAEEETPAGLKIC